MKLIYKKIRIIIHPLIVGFIGGSLTFALTFILFKIINKFIYPLFSENQILFTAFGFLFMGILFGVVDSIRTFILIKKDFLYFKDDENY